MTDLCPKVEELVAKPEGGGCFGIPVEPLGVVVDGKHLLDVALCRAERRLLCVGAFGGLAADPAGVAGLAFRDRLQKVARCGHRLADGVVEVVFGLVDLVSLGEPPKGFLEVARATVRRGEPSQAVADPRVFRRLTVEVLEHVDAELEPVRGTMRLVVMELDAGETVAVEGEAVVAAASQLAAEGQCGAEVALGVLGLVEQLSR